MIVHDTSDLQLHDVQPRKQGLETKLMVLKLHPKTKVSVPPKVPNKNVRGDPTKRKDKLQNVLSPVEVLKEKSAFCSVGTFFFA